METKIYTSYEEIDRDLEILKLQKEIDYKKLSLSVEKTIDSFTPNSFIQSLLGNLGSSVTIYDVLQKIAIPFLVKKFIK